MEMENIGMNNQNSTKTNALKDLEFHEIANIFPMMDHDRLMELVEDIRQNGLLDPIELYDGKILDGRNRYKACLLAGVEPIGNEYTGEDPLKHVLSKNLHRRHMDESQRAMVGANIANLKRGGDGSNQHEKSKSANLQISSSVAEAAEAVNVGVRSIASAKKVVSSGDKSLQTLVVSGQLPVSAAERFTKIVTDKNRQAEIIEKQGVSGVKDIVKEERKAKKLESTGYSRIDDPRTKTKKDDSTSSSVCTSMQFAELAIAHLERIQDWHARKLEAFRLVRDWMDNKERVWTNGK
jgi:hypothetical protein